MTATPFFSPSGSAPATDGFAITKHDSTNFDVQCRAIFVGGAGVVAVVFPNDNLVNFTCVAGTVLPVRAKRVNSTNTTATLMVGLL
jgi:hypothetical protein